MRFRQSDTAVADIDMTSMLDVVFIMLIFFIITSSFVKESGLTFQRPQSATGPSNPVSKTLLVTLHADGGIVVANRDIDKRSLPAWIESQGASDAVNQVIVQASAQASTEDLVAVVDQLKSAGVERISVGTFE